MKKTTLVLFSVALVFLLGLAVYVTFLVLASGTSQQTYPYAPDVQQNFQHGPGGRGRMGPGMMGPRMMGPIDAFINSEYDFLVHMIPHHEEAVSAAGILKENTEREEMEKFAEDIIRTQSEEIEQMTTWLTTWYPEKDHDIDYQPMMRDLENLKGEALDRAFLEDMIFHHMEAVMMSQHLISQGLAEHEEIASLARNISNTQRDEIHMMRNWMAEWYGNAQIAGTSSGIMMIWIGLTALAVLIVLAVLAVWLIRVKFSGSTGSMSKVSSVKSARELLDMRYAKGEVSQEEYLNARKNLES